MSREQFNNELRGVLFKNDKQGVETRADYRGDCEVNHVEYWINAWLNTDRNGRKFMSLKFRSKEAARAQGDTPRAGAPAPRPEPRKDYKDDFNDDIPF